jgi:hypothetical protein
VEANILQVFEVACQDSADEPVDEPLDVFEVFVAKKKKRENRAASLPEL